MSVVGLRIIDFHAHFVEGWKGEAPAGPVGEYVRQRWQRMREEWNLPEPVWGLDRRELARLWAEEVARHGLERVVFVTGASNHALSEVVAACPDRFSGLAHHDLNGPDPAGELRRAVDELGLSGLKVLAPRLQRPFEDPSLEPVWEFLSARRLPVVIHFGLLGHGGGLPHPLTSPLTLAATALRYPDIPFVVPHFGCGYWGELLQLCWNCPNVYVDTSGSNQWVRWMPYELDLEALFRKAYQTVGPARIIFGTDSSWFPRGFAVRYLEEQLRVCRWLGIKGPDLEAIFYGNAARLLGLKV
ncbi:MAG: amidohydrolase family protein [Acetobacteraceae bacterium]|nr:amidohydrolase family protein [Acetobacteraceae bacterium]